jgi:hypothetical protein
MHHPHLTHSLGARERKSKVVSKNKGEFKGPKLGMKNNSSDHGLLRLGDGGDFLCRRLSETISCLFVVGSGICVR